MSWKKVKIGDVCKTGAGGTPLKLNNDFYDNGSIPWLQSGEVAQKEIFESKKFITELGLKNSSAKLFPPNTVLVAMYGATAGQVGILRFESSTNQAVCGILPNDKFIPEFIYYSLLVKQEELIATATGNAQPNISQIKIKNTEIPLLSISEQKRIVAILDEAFAGIDQAIANTEKNLASARELFDSTLNTIFTQKGDGWIDATLSEVCSEKITDGTHQTPKYFDNGYIFLSSKNVTSRSIDWENVKYIDEAQHKEMHKRISPKRGDILLAKNGTTGVAAIVDRDVIFDIYVSLAWLRPSANKILSRFMWHFINSPIAKDQFNKRLKGVGVPNLHLQEIREVVISYPESLDLQKNLVQKLDNLLEEKDNLEKNFLSKISLLKELKQSLLQKAFRGELAANNIVEFSKRDTVKSIQTNTPEFSAHILAFAYHWHVSQRREQTFGHVKAQKLLHLSESIANIDLGREPIKDAAGPNDFPHMLKAKEWATANQFFEFVQRNGGYDFKKMSNYSAMIGQSLEAIKPYKDRLEKILGIILNMNTKETEVLATVHAAWNNLILDGLNPTENEIVKEARENWHSAKLTIPENEFKKSIQVIKANGIIPNGKAKRVGGQGALL